MLLIVNTASKCGFTPQYKGLEALYEKLHGKGLEILGFPCNQFGAQEPGSEAEIETVLRDQLRRHVSAVREDRRQRRRRGAALPASEEGEAPGLLGSEAIKWNFTKFLVDREGNVVERYAPNAEPASLAGDIDKLL